MSYTQPALARFAKKKSGENLKLVTFIPYKSYFSNEDYSDSDRSCHFLSFEIFKFQKCLMVPEFYAKMYEKMTKIRLYEKRYNFETNKKLYFNI